MTIQRYEAKMCDALTAVYNRAIRPVPHCYEVSPREFDDVLIPALRGTSNPERHSEAIFVALDGDSIVGYIHVAIGSPAIDGMGEEGLIRFFWYLPGQRELGLELLETAEAYLADKGMSAVAAFPQHHTYSFYYLKPAYLSDKLGHVAALLGFKGYARVAGEVFLDWRDFSAEDISPLAQPIRYSIDFVQGQATLPGVTVRAHQGAEEVGVCICRSVGEYSRAREAQTWFFTDWLGVEEKFRGQKIGRQLLQKALWEGLRLGYRHATISTAWDNHRAFVFYSNFGYRVSDWTYGLRHTLGQ